MSHLLDPVNLTEMQQMCRESGIGNVGRNLSRGEFFEVLDGIDVPEECPLEEIRAEMQSHIKKNFRNLRTQLPGCNGKCTSYGCPDAIVQRCWKGFKKDML